MKRNEPSEAAALPGWLPIHAWNAYLEMRRRKRAVPTDYALILLIRKLGEFHARGISIAEVLDKSVLNNWTDIYEPSASRDGSTTNKAAQRQAENDDAINRAAAAIFGVAAVAEADEGERLTFKN